MDKSIRFMVEIYCIFKKTHTTSPWLKFSLLSYCAYFSNESSKFWIKYWHYKYGNCFIFNSGKAAPIFKSNKPGPSHGMVIWDFTLNYFEIVAHDDDDNDDDDDDDDDDDVRFFVGNADNEIEVSKRRFLFENVLENLDTFP